jgi:hypothetical protein
MTNFGVARKPSWAPIRAITILKGCAKNANSKSIQVDFDPKTTSSLIDPAA